MNKPLVINYSLLARLFQRKRAEEGLAMRDVEKATGVSYSTLWRVENGNARELGTDRLLLVMQWLGVGFDVIAEYNESSPTPYLLESLVFTDEDLSAEGKELIIQMVRIAYRSFSIKRV